MNFSKNSKGITLIALVITIIVLLILAGVSLSLIMGNDGILERAENATNKYMIASVEEDVQLAIADLSAAYYQNEDVNAGESLNEYIARKLNGYKTQSGATIEIAEGEGDVEFKYTYAGKTITGTFNTETSGITISGVTSDSSGNSGGNGGITPEPEPEPEPGPEPEPEPEPEPTKYVVTFNANGGVCTTKSLEIEEGKTYGTLPGATKDGYTFLGWYTEIEDGTHVQATDIVTSDITLYARWYLMPKVVVKSVDTSNLTRKTNKSLADLFEIKWGDDGSSTNINYTVTGNLTFKNTSFNSTGIKNTSELELGTYTVKCKITSPTGKTAQATKNVKIANLAQTTVTNASNTSLSAKAIYSGYDLAYFRDLVNGGQNTLNAKLMNDIDLSKVCANTVEDEWVAIGACDDLNWEKYIVYKGFFEGNKKIITNLYTNRREPDATARGLIGVLSGTVQNVIVKGNIRGNNSVGGIVGWNKSGTVYRCGNYANVDGFANIGGVVGYNDGIISQCYNKAPGAIDGELRVGGIAGCNEYGSVVDCYNHGYIKVTDNSGGGCIGDQSRDSSAKANNLYNIGKIDGVSYAGGICGYITNGKYNNWINAGTVTGASSNSGKSSDDYCGYITGYWSSGAVWGKGAWLHITADELKNWTQEEIQTNLSSNFIKDKNTGYPVFSWE